MSTILKPTLQNALAELSLQYFWGLPYWLYEQKSSSHLGDSGTLYPKPLPELGIDDESATQAYEDRFRLDWTLTITKSL